MNSNFSISGGGEPKRRLLPITLGLLLGASAVGAAIPIYAGAIGDSFSRMIALPAAIALMAFLLLDRRKLLIVILVFRAAGDVFFEATRFSLGGYQVGVGGVVNAFVILIVMLLVAERPDVLPRKALAAWAGFLLAVLIGVVFAPVKADAIRTWLAVLSYAAVFCGAFYVARAPGDFKFCVRIVLWSSAIPVVYALVELLTGTGHGGGSRVQGTFAHPNIFAFYLVLIISMVLYMLKSGGKTVSLLAQGGLVLYMLLLLVLLLMTQTRSAWVACISIFLLYGLLFERRYLIYVALAPLIALLFPSVQDRMFDLAAGNDYVQNAQLNSFAWRRLIWESGLQWMRPDHYLLGYGLDAFRHYSLVFFPLVNPNGSGSGAHNVYVQVLFELGIAGFLALLWLFCRLFWMLKGMRFLDPHGAFVSIAAVAAYMIISMSDNMLAYLSFNWYFWFLVGSACAVVHTPIRLAQKLNRSGTRLDAMPEFSRRSP